MGVYAVMHNLNKVLKCTDVVTDWSCMVLGRSIWQIAVWDHKKRYFFCIAYRFSAQ